VTLILRRAGRGNWSPVRLAYDPARHAEWPTPVDARVGARLELFGVTYRVSRVEA
jgi:hypothetical protein